MDVVITVSAKRVAAALGFAVLVLIAASLGTTWLSFIRIDDPFMGQVRGSAIRLAWVDGEGNIPAWYSASLLLLCSLLLAAIAIGHRQHGGSRVFYWLILSLIFAFLSLDETAQLHELSIRPLRERLQVTGLLYYPWIIPAAVLVALLAGAYWRFLMNLPARTRRLFVIAGSVFLAGAIGTEAISGMHASFHSEDTLTYHLIVTLEEMLEMAGVVVFIYALMDYIGRQFTRLGFQFTSR